MKLKISVGIIFSLFIFSTANSQRDYINGYIVDNNNDTIYGKIKDRKSEPFGKLYSRIRFKENGGPSVRFSPYNIKGYKKGNEDFISMWFFESSDFFIFRAYSSEGKGKKRFFKIAEEGYLTMYHLYYEDEDGIDFTIYFKRSDAVEMVSVRTGIFGLNKKRLISYFKDCPVLQKKIESNEISNPYEVLRFYNKWYYEKEKASY
jgi:hypothetical protein